MQNKIIGRILRRLRKHQFHQKLDDSVNYPVRLLHKGNKKRKTVLFSYIPSPLLIQDPNSLTGHSNKWESREIANIFFELGYDVDAISWTDFDFVPDRKYDVIFDICYNLSRLQQFFGKDTIKLLHNTGSAPEYQNQAEARRVAEVNKRKNGNYVAKRMVKNSHQAIESIELADHISLIGNEYTLSTFPQEIQKKINLVTVSASDIGANMKTVNNFVPSAREFLWYFGSGAVHKGLDRVLEVFSIHPELTLNVIGNVAVESDFIEIYKDELYNRNNIHYHGYLLPTSQEFHTIINRVFCFIAPTCSEGISTAVATCLQIGLFPIISHDTGISLPDNYGIYLETSEIAEIENAVLHSYNMRYSELEDQIIKIQQVALTQYTRDKFTKDMKEYFQRIL